MRRNPLRVVWPLLLGGCVGSLHDNWATYAYAGAQPHSETHVMIIECAGPATMVRADLNCDTKAGDLSLRLVDPSGVERHVESVQGRRKSSLRWPAQTGIWQLHVTAKDLVGSWSAEFAATDQPVGVTVGVSIDSAAN